MLRAAVASATLWLTLGAAAQAAALSALPETVAAALARSGLPPTSLSLLVAPAEVAAAPRLSWRAAEPVNPASVMKLVTTFAGLELLGPAFSWRTSVYLDGALGNDGTLRGNLVLEGGGDPKLVAERLWLLLRRVRGLGIERIAGDIVLDATAFERGDGVDPAAFDNEPLRPYNAQPDALLVNFKALQFEFVPDLAAGVARVHVEPPLQGVEPPRSVPLIAGECRDWRSALKADFGGNNAMQPRFDGAFATACGAKSWSIAPPDADAFASRAIAGLWRSLGGGLTGQVRAGRVPSALAPVLRFESPPLAELIRDINKFSNNLMARQLFLTLSLNAAGRGSAAGSRALIARWWAARFPGLAAPLIDNGSGLSRDARIRADALGALLQAAFASPLMPEFIASLPLLGVDGTLRRGRAEAPSAGAHLKTGSLRDVAAIAGYVDGASGRRHVLVAIVNDPNAAAARPVFDALIEWTRSDRATAPPR